ncbi:DUF968 domain-containing protein [Xanthobacter agilis]|uniref:Uncharacterized protein n=1 Tax=Xanthobacter agilis TaxID=47492 RepID=A0ABU0LFU0_XANAG|nr:hypothetical protein [Xanthobacter agilis]MDQ0505998.1 hypothetical protein [Xanthobacter agilis]
MAGRVEPDGGWELPIPKGGHPPRRERKASAKPARDRGRQHDEAHLALIRQCPCISTGRMDRVEAAHLRFSEEAFGKIGPGHSAKPSDEWVLPLTHEEHMRQHSMGEEDFWSGLGIEPLKIAQQLYGISSAMRMSKESDEEIIRHMTNIITRARADARLGK